MRSKELSVKDTKMLQALSVMAMLCLHLFDTRDYFGKFSPILFVGGGTFVFVYRTDV